MTNCPHCGKRLKPTPNESTYAKNKETYKVWLRLAVENFRQNRSPMMTVCLLRALDFSRGGMIGYQRVRILLRHGLIKMAVRGTRGRQAKGDTVGEQKNTPNLYQLTKKGVELWRESSAS